MNLKESIRRILREDKLYVTPRELVKNLPQELKELLFKQWGAKQNPEWHPEGNTLKHIIVVIRRAYHHYPDDPNMIMAALFHDLGKIDTYKINPKTGQPTAYGHEDKSTDYVEQFRDWIESFEGTDVDEIKYLVKNHMKVKPSTWDQMKDKKKEPIKSHPAFDKLMGFTDKLDGGGTDIKESIRRILREDQLKLDLFDEKPKKYKPCSNFTDKDENELCLKIDSLNTFLYENSGLGLKNIINSKLNQMMSLRDVNENYQEPLKLLYDTKKYNQPKSYDYISETKGYYENKALKSVNRVFDANGKFDYINKLNTNYADLAELLTELLKRGNMVQKLNVKNVLGVRNYLLSIKNKLEKVLDKYIDISEYRSFVRNTTFRSQIGEQAENDVKNILEKY